MSDDNEKPRRELRLESPEPMMSMDDPTMVVPGLSDDEDSPTRMSEGLLTPPQLPLGYGRSEPILVSGAEHGNGDGLDRRMGYQNASPAMSPMLHPTLSSKPKLMTSHLMRQNSAPTTPKGHPIVEEGYFTSALKVSIATNKLTVANIPYQQTLSIFRSHFVVRPYSPPIPPRPPRRTVYHDLFVDLDHSRLPRPHAGVPDRRRIGSATRRAYA